MDDVFEEFNESKIDEYIPITDDDVTAKEIEGLVKKLGPEHLTNIDGKPVFNPNIKPLPLVRQESIGASFVRTLYINKADIETPSLTTIQRVTTSINIINEYLSRSGLHWKITFDTIKGKLSKDEFYLVNTLYGIWHLADGANLVMGESLLRNPDATDSTTLIIDYCNLKGGLSRCRPYREPDEDFADEINDWTMDTFGPTNRIIISIQANNIREANFISFKDKLRDIFGAKNIIIIVGSDSSSYDDLNIAYIVTKLLPESNKYIISSDKFRDLHRINVDGSTSPIFINKDSSPVLRMIKVEDTFCEDDGHGVIRARFSEGSVSSGDGFSGHGSSSGFPGYGYGGPGASFSGHGSSSSGPSSSLPGSTRKRGRYGGTNKNKKSLLNKYTRKVKKLHKKRIPTKKVVKKYNKNYKNYKKKTLKRKHK
jgi:hypothetical protein